MKKCPFCAEEIQDAAIVCKHCGRDLRTGTTTPAQSATIAVQPVVQKRGMGVGAIIAVLLCGGLFFMVFLAWCATAVFGPSAPQRPAMNTSSPAPTQPASPPAPAPVLRTQVTFTGSQFVVKNLNAKDWTDVTLDLNGGLISHGYILRVPKIAELHEYVVGAMQFANSDGQRFNPFQMKPQKMAITAHIDGQLAVDVVNWQ